MVSNRRTKEIVDAIESLQRAESALDALDAARRIRQAAEGLERDQIDAARAAGYSWSKVGAVYGLTKQGAQQRFRNDTSKTFAVGSTSENGPGGTPKVNQVKPGPP